MKPIYYLLVGFLLLFSCSKANEATEEGTYQDYTSFVFRQDWFTGSTNVAFRLAFRDSDGNYEKFAEFIKPPLMTPLAEERIEIQEPMNVYLFANIMGDRHRYDTVFIMKVNALNKFTLNPTTHWSYVSSYTDPKQYPQ